MWEKGMRKIDGEQKEGDKRGEKEIQRILQARK